MTPSEINSWRHSPLWGCHCLLCLCCGSLQWDPHVHSTLPHKWPLCSVPAIQPRRWYTSFPHSTSPFLLKNLKIYFKGQETEKEWENFHPADPFSRYPPSGALELNASFPHEWQGPMYLTHHLFPPMTHINREPEQEAEWEIVPKQPRKRCRCPMEHLDH